MSDTLERIVLLIQAGDLKISEHGYDEIADEGILVRDIVSHPEDAVVVEDYPNYAKGPCVLVLQRDLEGRPLHVVWGIPKGASSPAVLVTAYRPDPDLWTKDLMRRRK
jgi:Domain of unknown function (DUF4258)